MAPPQYFHPVQTLLEEPREPEDPLVFVPAWDSPGFQESLTGTYYVPNLWPHLPQVLWLKSPAGPAPTAGPRQGSPHFALEALSALLAPSPTLVRGNGKPFLIPMRLSLSSHEYPPHPCEFELPTPMKAISVSSRPPTMGTLHPVSLSPAP